MPLIRYPGSKEKLAADLWRLFPQEATLRLWSHCHKWEYREPFFGAGAIGFRILDQLDRRCRVWINDADADIVMLWKSVRDVWIASQEPRSSNHSGKGIRMTRILQLADQGFRDWRIAQLTRCTLEHVRTVLNARQVEPLRRHEALMKQQRCQFCRPPRELAVATVTIECQKCGVCLNHLRAAYANGFHPQINGSDMVCHWGTPLSQADIERLVRAEGDCVAAGIPCLRHGGASE